MNLMQIIKLAKILTKLENISTDKGVLTTEAIEIGKEIYVEKEGEIVPAEDGEYVLDDKRIINILEGKITDIKDAPAPTEGTEGAPTAIANEGEGGTGEGNTEGNEPTPEEPKEDENILKIKELEDIIKARDEEIARLKEEIEGLKSKPVEEMMSKTEKTEFPFKSYKKN